MLKFDLTRKYLVGFLTLAMVLSLFALPVSAATPGPIVNATYTTVITPLPNPATGTPTWPVNTTATMTIRFYNGPDLVDPVGTGTMYFYNSNAFPVDGTPATHIGVGTWTGTWPNAGTPTIIPFIAYMDTNGSGQPNPQYEPSSVARIEWTALAYGITLNPTVATNPEFTAHTIAITVKDQFGGLGSGTVTIGVSGLNTINTTHELTGGTTTFTYTDTSVSATAESAGIKGHDHITVTSSAGGTVTGTKFWSYTPSLGLGHIHADPANGYNLIGQTHTVTISFFDQYGYPMTPPATSTLNIKVSGTNSISTNITTFTGTYYLYQYHSHLFGVDTITASMTTAGTKLANPAALNKYWAYDWAVTPADAVNVMGAWHNIYIYGAPYDRYNVQWSTQFGSTQQPILAVGSSPWSGAIGLTGVATITCKAEWPGKYFFDVTITMTDNRFVTGLLGTEQWPLGTEFATARYPYTSYTTKVAKSWAQLTGFDITPPSEINPITQTPSDTHTVTVTVLGEYPVKYSLTLPNIDPPLGGTYWVSPAGILWVIDAPLANVPVDWKVQWTDQTVNRVYVDSSVDPGGNPIATHYAPGILPFWFTATSVSDEYGEASLTYILDWTGVGTPTTGSCTYVFPCINETITATAEYPEQALTDEFGTITGTATKEWRDHPFKLIKYNGHLPIGYSDYIAGAKFFLKWSPTFGALTTAATYYVPWFNPGSPYSLPNSLIYNAAPNNHLVTTDTYGEAIWFHLPYGRYYLYEASVPAPYYLPTTPYYTDYHFDITADAPNGCSDPKYTIHYEVNTPTNPYFYKITYCGTKMVGVTFEVTSDEGETNSYVTDSNGRLSINLADFDPPFDSTYGTEYKVHEVSNAVLTSYGVYAVPDFYFFITKTGVWEDQEFYDDYYDEVWPVTSLAWAWTTAANHWVIDPQIGTEPVQPIEITLDLLEGWNLVSVPLVTNDIIADLFGVEFIRAYAWDPTLPDPYGGGGSYWNCSYAAPEPGAGFWVKMAADDAVTMEGMAVGSPVALDLYEGWNMVANPFDVVIDWDTVTLGGDPIADTTAMAFSFDGTMYHMVDFVTDSMGVGQGFWLLLDADATIEFTSP